ncbi:hypothetical protein HYR99_22450 [Candidatus Poribacteria bacterium]|nr:hypothetical protein [Candidatus Poribacteria bacterium]
MEHIESLIKTYERLKQKNTGVTIDSFVAKQPPEIHDELAARLHYQMFRGWVAKHTRWGTYDWIRKQRAQRRGGGFRFEPIDGTTEGDSSICDLTSPDDPVKTVMDKEIDILEPLSEEEKLICIRHRVDELTHEKIGEILGESRAAVSKAYSRAIAKLRKLCDEEIKNSLEQLPGNHRKIYALYFDGYKDSAIGNKLGMSEETVRKERFRVFHNQLKKTTERMSNR